MGGPLPLTVAGLAGFGWLLIAVAGLHIALRLGGVPMLGQSAAVAAGAFLTASWTPELPLLVALACAVAVAGAAGWLLGWVAGLRSAGDPAVATWALGWLALTSVTAGLFVTTEADLPIPVHLVVPAGGFAVTLGETGESVVALTLAALCLLGVRRLAAGPLDARLALTRQAPEFAGTIGVPVTRLRAGALGCGCALGALAGAGYLTLQGVSGPTDVSPTLSIELLAAVLVAPRRWWGIPCGAAALQVLVHLTDPAVASAVLIVAAGLIPHRRGRALQAPPSGVATLPPEVSPAGVSVGGVDVTLGGRAVLTGFALEVSPGQVHALLGPNGAGKTTALRVIAGELPASGSVRVPRAVRTLQSTPATGGIEPHALVIAAVPAQSGAGFRHLVAARSSRSELARRTQIAGNALALVGYEGTSSVDDRLLQLACAWATGAPVVALDEPAAGVERRRIAAAITAIAASGRTVVLVEHDLRLVRAVAERASLLLDGRVVVTADVPAIFDEPVVRDSYLRAGGAAVPG